MNFINYIINHYKEIHFEKAYFNVEIKIKKLFFI